MMSCNQNSDRIHKQLDGCRAAAEKVAKQFVIGFSFLDKHDIRTAFLQKSVVWQKRLNRNIFFDHN